jgi:hypothetical protein
MLDVPKPKATERVQETTPVKAKDEKPKDQRGDNKETTAEKLFRADPTARRSSKAKGMVDVLTEMSNP